ncbi:condensation domain-containing protein [Streptomyces sp. INA 01156]
MTSALLGEVCQVFHARANEVLLAGLALAVPRWRRARGLDGDDVLLDVEGHGREDVLAGADVSRTVGWFTSLFPVRLHSGTDGVDAAVKRVKEQLRAVPDNGIGYGLLRHLDPGRGPCSPRCPFRRSVSTTWAAWPVPPVRPTGPRPASRTCCWAPASPTRRWPYRTRWRSAPSSGTGRTRVPCSPSPGCGPRACWTRPPSGRSRPTGSTRCGTSPRTPPCPERAASPGRPAAGGAQSGTDRPDRGGAPAPADILPVAPLQEGLLFHAMFDEGGPDVYSVQFSFGLDGPLDAGACGPPPSRCWPATTTCGPRSVWTSRTARSR